MKRIFSSLSDTSILLLLAAFGVLIHTLLNGQYGFHRDELDILMNARQLDWGYVAYPPFTPFIARIGLELFGTSLQGLRIFSAIAQGVVMLLAGWMARDMGGRRNAQVLAAIAAYIAPVALTSGTLIQYMAFDYLWWVVIAFFFVRLLATQDPRYWLGIGAGIGLGMMTKFTVAFWVAGLIVAVLLSPIRRHLLSKWLWLGAALALVIYMPNLIWQIRHEFISLDFLKAIHARDLQWGRANNFLPDQLISSTNPFTLPVWIAGSGCVPVLHFNETLPPAGMDVPDHVHHLPDGTWTFILRCSGVRHAAGSRQRMELELAVGSLRKPAPGRDRLIVRPGGCGRGGHDRHC